MIFFANAQGSITKIITEEVYQGSVGVNRVVLVAPYPINATVTVAFTLPNGIRTPENLALPNMTPIDLGELLKVNNDVKYNAWTYLLEEAITEYAGTLVAQFIVRDSASRKQTTFATTLTVQKGVAPILPETPNPTVYEEILNAFAYVNERLGQLENMPLIKWVDSLPTENIDTKAIYAVSSYTDQVVNYYVYTYVLPGWLQINKSVITTANSNAIVDSTKLYILTADSNGLSAGVYVVRDNKPLKLLTSEEYTVINNEIARVEAKADNAQSTANTAQSNATTAYNTAQSAVGIANTASTDATDALNKATDALNKVNSVTGGLILKGNVTSINDLPEPSAETLGFLYNVNDAFTTNEQFVEGAGISYLAGENVAIVEPTPGVYKYDVFSGLVDLTPLENEINDLKGQVADLLYKAITITSFTNNVNTVEIGSTVTSVNLSWAFSKKPKTVTLDGTAKSVTSTGESLTGLSITSGKTWTLRATDERDTATSRTTSISFLNGVYYGVAEAPDTYDSSFVLGLRKDLRSSKLTSFDANAGAGQFIYYCIPTRFGTASFKVGGFDGGFSLVATISFTNSQGYTENYYIYKSDNANLGATSVSVS